MRRAMAIQLIINRELGLAKNENPLQGSFIIEELTDLVEEAVLAEFDRITERGGVLGAMETHVPARQDPGRVAHVRDAQARGELPIVGVNTFLSAEGSPFMRPDEVIRSADDDKDLLVADVAALKERSSKDADAALAHVQQVALDGGNVFEALVDAVRFCSLGQLSDALFEVGGRYRRNM